MIFFKTQLKAIVVAVFIISSISPYQSFVSADVIVTKNTFGWDEVNVVNKIVKGDFCKLIKCLSKYIENGEPEVTDEWDDGEPFTVCPVGWVRFDSVAGDVQEAIKIGRFLREGLVEVVIDDKCYSSCFTAVTGAVFVHEGLFTEVGIHRMFLDKETLTNMSMQEYEKVYNKIKMETRTYFIDMDVPISIIEKIFTIPSGDLYILKDQESEFLRKNPPAYDEWIEARCPNSFSKEEHKDFLEYRESSPQKQKRVFSKGYTDYLSKKYSELENCRKDVRWKQFESTVHKYLKKCK